MKNEESLEDLVSSNEREPDFKQKALHSAQIIKKDNQISMIEPKKVCK